MRNNMQISFLGKWLICNSMVILPNIDKADICELAVRIQELEFAY